jgi:hypothetical protein
MDTASDRPGPHRPLGVPQAHHLDVREWDQTVYGAPLNVHGTCLDGPATVRIFTKRGLGASEARPLAEQQALVERLKGYE